MIETKRYCLTVRLLEDLHTGTGTGSGDIDACHIRDRYGRPVIRASHLKGVMLAAGEELVELEPQLAPLLAKLFGRPGGERGALRLTSLRLAEGVGKTLVWTSTAREEGDRRPKEDTMRSVEYAAAGQIFTAQLALPGDAQLHALLRRIVERLDRLGGDRNRGSGLIHGRLEEQPPEQAEALDLAVGCPLRLRLRNLEPICIPATGYPGNLIESLPFIRGQMLRGALLAWALNRRNEAAAAALRAACVGDALPLPPGMNEAALESLTVIPIPLSILTHKPNGGGAREPWWAAKEADAPQAIDSLAPDRSESEEKPKRPGANEFLARTASDAPWQRYSPQMVVHMRNQTADLFDCSATVQTEPQLFSSEEIAEDTCFVADLHFADAQDAQAFVASFASILRGAEWLAVGREGRPVVVEAVASPAAPKTETRFGDTWTLTLTSDLVARGKHLGFLENLDIEALIALADRQHQEFPQARDWKIDGVAETSPLHGFNAASGLRRTPALAIRRGSCWRIEGSGSGALAAALAQKRFVGERGEEGCGRFLLDVQPLRGIRKAGSGAAPPKSAPSARRSDMAAPPLEDNRSELILRAVKEIAHRPGATAPSLSQLQWLRGRALAVTCEEQLQALLQEIEQAPKRRPKGAAAWGKFPMADLRTALGHLASLEEKRQLVSQLVQWLTPEVRRKSEESRTS